MLSYLSRDWAALPVAAGAGLLGGLGCALGGDGGWAQALGGVVLVLAVVLATGSLVHLLLVARVRRRHPAPGRLVDVGGHRIHLLAEGDARGGPTVVWMPGGHAGGFAFHHLHRVLGDETRSILLDRPGAGWSDPGPFPRTTAGESHELMAALEVAGEAGPFVLVGHSFGGLLMANVARRWPERVAALVLVDATPPDTILYGPHIPGLAQMRTGAVVNALPRLLGLHVDLVERRRRRREPAAWRRITELVEQRLGEAGAALRAVERATTRAACAGASIFAELSPEGLAAVAWDTVVYEGDLGDLPVVLVAPDTMSDAEFEATAQLIEGELGPGRTLDRERLRRFYTRSRERYLTVSSNSRRVVAPADTGHNFPYEVPEFLLDVVRSALAEVAAARPEESVS